ncbi:MAG: sodium:proton antiporter [Bacteroidetes bacterium CG2_30_33_31]|nr:MAG: sodium:proton antiporter [Bacteroidetes bacterium CG2_30_33_31]
MKYSTDKVLEILNLVKHPESGKGLVEIGMVENLTIEGLKIKFDLVAKSGKDPFAKSLIKAAEKTLKFYLEEAVEVEITQTKKIFEAANFKAPSKPLSGVKNIIAVSSGKGGVGKSTVAANLAVALARTGAKVGLLDADIWGPSIPMMFGVEDLKPAATQVDGKTLILPIEKFGIKILSVGFFVDPNKALIWRGSMASNALSQLINEGDWGKLDYVVLDMPPGTGDIHLTLVQTLAVTGVIVVSTPQKVALADAKKGVAMYQQKDINVPVLGLVENMAYFTPAELPNNKYYLFGKDGCKNLAKELDVPLLGEIPIVQSIMESGDKGRPIALDEINPMGIAFGLLAKNVIDRIEWRNTQMNPTKKVQMKSGAGCATD